MAREHQVIATSSVDYACTAFKDFEWSSANRFYVRMPCSQFDLVDEEKKWDIVSRHFENCTISDFDGLREAICEYNTEAFSQRNDLFPERFVTKFDNSRFFDTLLPKIGKLALELPYLFERIPLLRSQRQKAVTMSQRQVACLLANAFLCTFPKQTDCTSPSNSATGSPNSPFRKRRRNIGYSFPDFSFLGIFTYPSVSNMEKIKCILHYFERIFSRIAALENNPQFHEKLEFNSLITIERRVLLQNVDWTDCEVKFGNLHVESRRSIEDSVSLRYMHGIFDLGWASPRQSASPAKLSSSSRDTTPKKINSSAAAEPESEVKSKLAHSEAQSETVAEQREFCAWQADFANKFLGGGVLNSGCVQEEILFVVYPECLVSLLITEVLDDNEALLIKGAQRFADYSGYAHTFRFKGEHFDSSLERSKFFETLSDMADSATLQHALRNLPQRKQRQSDANSDDHTQNEVIFDRFGRRNSLIFAVDAIPFHGDAVLQFHSPYVIRELNKFFAAICKYKDLNGTLANESDVAGGSSAGVRSTEQANDTRIYTLRDRSKLGKQTPVALCDASAGNSPEAENGTQSDELGWLDCEDPVVTGNWGCGAFGGDKELKALIQLCAAARCGRAIVYCTFGDRDFADQLRDVHRLLLEDGTTVKQMLEFIEDFYKSAYEPANRRRTFFDFLMEHLQ